MRPYSLDLRERIVAALQDGQTEKQVAARFGVSESTVTRYDRLQREAADLRAKTPPGRKSLLRLGQEPAFRELFATREDWTLATLAPAWQEDPRSGGVLLSKSALHVHVRRLGYSFKKRAGKLGSDLPRSALPSSNR